MGSGERAPQGRRREKGEGHLGPLVLGPGHEDGAVEPGLDEEAANRRSQHNGQAPDRPGLWQGAVSVCQ